MAIGVLALQGAFAEHEALLERLGATCREIRGLRDLEGELAGLVLPGGESTVQRKLLREMGLYEPMRRCIEDGLPVLATCAGLILLAEELEQPGEVCFGTLPVTVRRNAYGRQLGSFKRRGPGPSGEMDMIFIRAPLITRTGENVRVLATVDGAPVAVRYMSQIAVSFHPELSGDCAVHRLFLELCYGSRKGVL